MVFAGGSEYVIGVVVMVLTVRLGFVACHVAARSRHHNLSTTLRQLLCHVWRKFLSNGD